jgi:hypothetical protein
LDLSVTFSQKAAPIEVNTVCKLSTSEDGLSPVLAIDSVILNLLITKRTKRRPRRGFSMNPFFHLQGRDTLENPPIFSYILKNEAELPCIVILHPLSPRNTGLQVRVDNPRHRQNPWIIVSPNVGRVILSNFVSRLFSAMPRMLALSIQLRALFYVHMQHLRQTSAMIECNEGLVAAPAPYTPRVHLTSTHPE